MSNNNDNSGAILAFAFVATVATFMFAFIFAVVVFLSIIFTGVCFFAWNKPVTLFGETITPREAREFVARGLLGAFLLPCFVLFTSGLFGFQIRPDYWIFLPLGGYALGSLVVGYHIEKAKLEAAQQTAVMQALLPPEPPGRPVRMIGARSATPSAAESEPASQPQSFHFASWNDEEELRK